MMDEVKITEYQRKKNTIIFSIAVGVFNFIFMIALLVALFIVAVLVIYKVFNFSSSLPLHIVMPFILAAGLILDIILSVKIIRFIIVKFDLKDKINKKIADQYLYSKKSSRS